MIWEDIYSEARSNLISDLPSLVEAERSLQSVIETAFTRVISDIASDWDLASSMVPQWIASAPKQRGRAPSGDGVPWGEVAEKVPLQHLASSLAAEFSGAMRFPALPVGGDLRFSLDGWLVHLDAKAAGPNDLHDEIVVPPYQVSGDGVVADSTERPGTREVTNSPLVFPGRRNSNEYQFFPKLPPLYVIDGRPFLCGTLFLKVIYDVRGYGDQPLQKLIIAFVPNGLLLFNGDLVTTPGLFARGKDDASKPLEDHRARVKFPPLAAIDEWRVRELSVTSAGEWVWSNWPRAAVDG